MKRYFYKPLFALLAVFCLLFSSCIQIQEELHFNADGSGYFIHSANMSGMAELLKMGGEDSDASVKQMFSATDDMYNKLLEIDGISEFKNLNNESEMIVGYSFKFKNSAALNEAVKSSNDIVSQLNPSFGDENDLGATFIFDGKTLKRPNLKMEDEDRKKGEDEAATPDMAQFMEDFRYDITYSFDKKIKKAIGKNPDLLDDRKSVIYSYGWDEMLSGDLGVTIRLGK